MGTAKAGLPWDGRPLVAHVAATVAALVDGPVVVVGAPGQALPPLPSAVETVTDAEPGRGPLAGLLAGLDALEGRAEVALACATDQPLIAGAGLAELLVAARGCAAAAFVTADGLQPLGAAYRIEPCLDLARERLGRGEASLRGLLRAAGAATLTADAATTAALRSLDTPQAYAAARGINRA